MEGEAERRLGDRENDRGVEFHNLLEDFFSLSVDERPGVRFWKRSTSQDVA